MSINKIIYQAFIKSLLTSAIVAQMGSFLIMFLRAGWFPATFNRPQTTFTFRCLDFYHELTLQSKVNAYDFFRSLLRLTDSLELNKTSVCLFKYCIKSNLHAFFRITLLS